MKKHKFDVITRVKKGIYVPMNSYERSVFKKLVDEGSVSVLDDDEKSLLFTLPKKVCLNDRTYFNSHERWVLIKIFNVVNLSGFDIFEKHWARKLITKIVGKYSVT